MCYSDHQHFVRGQKHFLIASHPNVCDWFLKAGNERHTLNLYDLAIEKQGKTPEMSTFWGKGSVKMHQLQSPDS